MNEFINVPQIAGQISELAEFLKEHDFPKLENSMNEIKTENDLGKARDISEELSEMLKITEEYKRINVQNNTIDLVVRIIRLRKNLFDAKCARTIIITRFH